MRLRMFLLPAALLAAAALIGAIAIVDHRAKDARINRIEVSEWYCAHEGTRCGGPSSARVERRWNERQVAYEVVVAVLGIAAVAVAARRGLHR